MSIRTSMIMITPMNMTMATTTMLTRAKRQP